MKNRFRTLALVSVAALMLFALAACGPKAPATTEDPNKTPPADDKKVYTIASDTAFAPFEYMDMATQKYVGLDMDILDAIAKDQGFEYKMDNVGFKAATLAVQSGQADAMIAGMSITEERKETFDFSNGYYSNGQILVVAKGSNVQGPSRLEGKTVAAKASTEGHAYATAHEKEFGYTVATYEDSPSMYAAVTNGIDAACYEDAAVAIFSIKDQSLPLQTIGEEINPVDYGFAVKKGTYPELIEMFNKGLENIKANGTYDTILAKYGL